MLDMTISRYNPPKSILDIKYNVISLFRYFTIWILLLDILYLNSKVKNIEFFLFFIHIFIIFFCAKIFYFNLKEFRTKTYSIDIIFKGKLLLLIDIIFHYIPLILVISYMFRNKLSIVPNRNSMILCFMLPLTYFLLFDIKQVYGFDKNKGLIFYFMYTIIFSIIYQVTKILV